jgi:hypothetical protein
VAAEPDTLDACSLEAVRIGVSVSESVELRRLGLTDAHLRLALAEITRVVIGAGGTLVYGGHLAPAGYTAFLEGELDRYGRTDRPLHLVVGSSEHRVVPLSELGARRRALGLKGRFTYLDASGAEINPSMSRGEGPATVEPTTVPSSLTSLRRYLTTVTDARVLIGGKEAGYQGTAPGIGEEALLAIRAGQPIYVAGGFGGASATVAQAVCESDDRWPPRDDAGGDWVDAIREAIAETGWLLASNGLSQQENLQLATSHRSSGVATLVATGLSRAFAPA